MSKIVKVIPQKLKLIKVLYDLIVPKNAVSMERKLN